MEAKNQQDIRMKMLYRRSKGRRWLWVPEKQKMKKNPDYLRPMSYVLDDVPDLVTIQSRCYCNPFADRVPQMLSKGFRS